MTPKQFDISVKVLNLKGKQVAAARLVLVDPGMSQKDAAAKSGYPKTGVSRIVNQIRTFVGNPICPCCGQSVTLPDE